MQIIEDKSLTPEKKKEILKKEFKICFCSLKDLSSDEDT